MQLRKNSYPNLGFGLGLRHQHFDDIIEKKPAIDWFEIMTEDYLTPGGKHHEYLEKIRCDYPIVMHGVSLSIGGLDPLNMDYLKKLKEVATRIEAKWLSDHLCWTGIRSKNSHDLLPLPYTEEAINHIVNRLDIVQEFLGRRFLIENVSSYVTYNSSQISEWEFIGEIVKRSGCLLLLDVNNIYVSSFNHSFNPEEYLSYIPRDAVQQIHLAGHFNQGDYIIDTHDHDVIDEVWELYEIALKRFGSISTMIERDDNIPELSQLIIELDHARQIHQKVFAQVPA